MHHTVCEEARDLWYHQSPAREYALAVGISSWEALWARFTGDAPELAALSKWSTFYRCEAWSRALEAHQIADPTLAVHLSEIFPSERRRLHIVYPEVKPVLDALRERFPLALLTNGAPDLQWEKIHSAKLENYFDPIVVSGEYGVGKPDPYIFQLVLERLDVSPKAAVMIGNSLRSDIAGAQGVGLWTIWVNRNGQELEGDVQPHGKIRDLSQLPELLRVKA
jgi:putative hydrolase of the HAD superfamily